MRNTFFISCGAFVLTSLIASPFLVTAIDTTTSGRILDNFKQEEQKLLFETIPFDQSGSNELLKHEYTMNGLEGLKERLKGVEAMYQEKKNWMTERRTTLEEAITVIDSAIADTLVDIKKTEKSIASEQEKIEEYQAISSDLSEKIKRNRAIILAYLANIYSQSNIVYNEKNTIDVFQTLILSDEDIDTISTDIVYKSLVSILGQEFIKEYRSLIRQFYQNSLKIREKIALMESQKSLLEKQKSTLNAQKNQREQLLEITKGQEELFQKFVDAQKRAQEEVENSWQNVSKAYAASLDTLLEKNNCNKKGKSGKDIERCDGIRLFYQNERALSKISISTGTTNVMNWPVKNPRISTYFRDPSYYRALGSHHDAIDIAINQGSEVYAALDGYVYYILPPSPGGYSYLALKHPGGYVSVYGHLSEINVSPYQFVRKGDLIAKSGGAPGTPGAGPMTSGPHLHFEVFHKETPIDPLRTLNISGMKYEELPVRYQEKFISDLVETSDSGADIDKYTRKFFMKGQTEEERQVYLLKTYATPDFQNAETWIDTALEGGIDPSFVMCVGLAETTLGNHLKTPYNVGNVGNTDDGGTYDFSSPKEGISWMVSTLNNKFLSQYTYISELSRWGNTSGPIYASSNANWHNNIIKCMSELKGRFVEDDYNFRIE